MTVNSTKRALLTSAVALFLCFVMLIGTTFAWFTDEVTSSGNVIQTGNLKLGFQWAEGNEDPNTATWNDVDGALFDYAKWEPGYAVAKHLKVSNKGSLALNYKLRIVADGIVSDLADVIDVYVVDAPAAAMDRVNLDALTPVGTLTQVLLSNGADDAVKDEDKGVSISEIITGSLEAGTNSDVYTLVLRMNKNAGNEYQGMDLGCTFSVQLLATQASKESDSFDDQYDVLVPNEEIPAAFVRPIDKNTALYDSNGNVVINKGLLIDETKTYGGLPYLEDFTLDTAYMFQPTENYDDVTKSLHRYWHADYVVKADKDVNLSTFALAGYYNLFGGWVAITEEQDADPSNDTIISAGTEVRLLKEVLGGVSINYEEICKYGADGIGFLCGAADLTGENEGTTLTVELRIYETTKPWDATSGTANDEVGPDNYITIGQFKYTFGMKPWDGTYNATQLPAEDNGVITIKTAAQFAAFANDVNVNNNSYAGKTVVLANDIDLGNQAWAPIGQTGATQFLGTFDGQGNTIYNLKIDSSAQTGEHYSSGLFGWLNNATVKNVNVDGADIKGNHNVGVIAGYLETAGCTVSNCNVENATIVAKHATNDQCGDKVGVIVGHAGNAGVVVENCSAKDSTIVAGRDAGQIVGAAKVANVIGCTADNVTVTDGGDCTGANIKNEVIGRVLYFVL